MSSVKGYQWYDIGKEEKMGAINYGASYYAYENGKRNWKKDITIGIKPASDLTDEEIGYSEWLETLKAENEDFEETDDERSAYDYDYDNSRYDDVQAFLDNTHDMPEYFTINIENGYYEGFYLKIESNLPWLFEDYHEKQEYLKDVTVLKNILTTLIKEYGLCVVYPGWCTGYADETQSLKDLNDFVKTLRQEIKFIDTCAVYQRKQAKAG